MGFNGYYFKPRLWPTVMTIPIIALLCLLGNWQVERLNWKLDIIQKLEQRYSLPASNLADVIIKSDAINPDNWEYRHVVVSGRFLHMREMTLYGIGPDGRPGYDLFTPLLTQAGNYIIINRGWVPEALKEQYSRPQTINEEKVTVTGLLRKSWPKIRFAAENDPASNMWYHGDVGEMAQAQDLTDVFPMFIYADKGTTAGKYPIGGRTRLKIVNNHLDYAMTWYGLAIVLLGIYFIFNIRKSR